jgi:hypothetical protein
MRLSRNVANFAQAEPDALDLGHQSPRIGRPGCHWGRGFCPQAVDLHHTIDFAPQVQLIGLRVLYHIVINRRQLVSVLQ